MQEKNLSLLVELDRGLIAAAKTGNRFVIVGQGSERAWLERELPRAEFTDVLHGQELARAYASMNLLVFPSRTDSFGNVVQEALAAGTPVLVTQHGGPKYVVESGVTGCVAESDRDFINKAIALTADHQARQQMRVAARQAACSASRERVFESVWESYEICVRLPARKTAVVRKAALPSENAA
jgi:glycosyltransferase involved in cell wall biosynthesis